MDCFLVDCVLLAGLARLLLGPLLLVHLRIRLPLHAAQQDRLLPELGRPLLLHLPDVMQLGPCFRYIVSHRGILLSTPRTTAQPNCLVHHTFVPLAAACAAAPKGAAFPQTPILTGPLPPFQRPLGGATDIRPARGLPEGTLDEISHVTLLLLAMFQQPWPGSKHPTLWSACFAFAIVVLVSDTFFCSTMKITPLPLI